MQPKTFWELLQNDSSMFIIIYSETKQNKKPNQKMGEDIFEYAIKPCL